MASYFPENWFWLVTGETRAWSSAAAAYVDSWPADRLTPIATLGELDLVLRGYGLRSPLITAADVRAECSRRLQLLVGARDANHLETIISNGTREAVRLLRKGAVNWTEEEAVRAAQLEALDGAVDHLRACSNAMEGEPPLDYAADSRWGAT